MVWSWAQWLCRKGNLHPPILTSTDASTGTRLPGKYLWTLHFFVFFSLGSRAGGSKQFLYPVICSCVFFLGFTHGE